MTFKLYDYQTKLVQEARISLAKGHKGVMIVSPPGSGKSVVIAEIARLTTDRNNRVMFLVHRKELADQITATFAANDVDLNLCTIMTVTKIANRLGRLPKPSLIITDETHHSRAATYRNIYDHYNDVPRLGFTATPWRMNGKGFDDIYSEMVEGPSVRWLIDNGRLAPYDYYSVSMIELEKLKKSSRGDFTKQSIDDALKKTIFGDLVGSYRKYADDQQAILYAHSVEYSQLFANEFVKDGIKAIHVDSKTPAKERDKIMADFKAGEIKVLCNVDLISEGFDVPDCSCVIMVRPTESLVLYLQQSMRCMRFKTGKKAVIIDHVANFQKHFLPDSERIWKLNGFDKRKQKDKKAAEAAEVQCPSCLGVMFRKALAANDNNCIYCGEGIESSRDNSKEIINAELQQVNIVKFSTDYSKINLLRKYRGMQKNEIKTIEDAYLFAKAHNYKDSWIKHNIKAFHTYDWAAFYIALNPIIRKYSTIFN